MFEKCIYCVSFKYTGFFIIIYEFQLKFQFFNKHTLRLVCIYSCLFSLIFSLQKLYFSTLIQFFCTVFHNNWTSSQTDHLFCYFLHPTFFIQVTGIKNLRRKEKQVVGWIWWWGKNKTAPQSYSLHILHFIPIRAPCLRIIILITSSFAGKWETTNRGPHLHLEYTEHPWLAKYEFLTRAAVLVVCVCIFITEQEKRGKPCV